MTHFALQPVRHPVALPDTEPESLAEFASRLACEHEEASDHDFRRDIGQVFTPPPVARFMAEQLGPIGKTYRLLDPGAGAGALAAAVCDRVLRLKSTRHLVIHLYESDTDVIPSLRRVMQRCAAELRAAGHALDFTIHAEDFVLSRGKPSLFERDHPVVFDGVVMNPPYFKIAKDSPHARAMTDVVHGQPNIYALFMAVAAEKVRPGGHFVAITPRSYCNGLYFREFRRWFFDRMSLRRVHLFESRRSTFKESQVLQESLITVATRRGPAICPPDTITVSSSAGRDLADVREREHSVGAIIDDTAGDNVVRIPATPIDSEIMSAVEAWPAKFVDQGLRISTGPVVTFRARQFLLADASGVDAIPLLSVHNVRPFETVWPLAKGTKPIAFRHCPESKGQVLPSRNYVLLRRFSAKEENRRLTASCYLPTPRERRRPVALENHLNYVYLKDREFTDAETVGLAALFNSALLDRYFRMLSGNTQVNATEIRTMPFPDLKTIGRIGNRVRMAGTFARDQVEKLVLAELGINGSVSQELLGASA